MVTKYSPTGLIATTGARCTPPLDEMVRSCGWPLVLESSPRLLARELALHNPECVLFWLEDQQSIAPTARLVEWSRQRGSRPLRVAVAYRMEADVEAVFRAAGAHGFLPVTVRSTRLVIDALRPMLAELCGAAAVADNEFQPSADRRDRALARELPIDLARPP